MAENKKDQSHALTCGSRSNQKLAVDRVILDPPIVALHSALRALSPRTCTSP
ncbi:hypothetical protein HS088_TW16G00118 [Tripterygium wilfordii]|uniref:Uncharacterized protein n=1 Tax=Tripterygium wilfordii TaxID=458696 RepID=A0A7J7CI01_TRIWF|nr:hypothetical protein HS088_TW16G00118 [Tripterygium wilfordii]